MEETRSRRAAARAERRARRAPAWFRIRRWTLLVGAVVLAAMWIWTALTSNHSTPWYNDWLIILVLYALFWMLATPRLVFHRSYESAQREPPREPQTLRHTAAYLVAFFGGLWIFGFPMQYAEISRIAAITEIDGDEVAIVSYNRVGPRGLLQMVFGMETQRVVAVDLETGDHRWDVQTSQMAYTEQSVLGINDGYVYVKDSEDVIALRLDDGSADPALRAAEEIADAWTAADASPSGTESTAATSEGPLFVANGVLSLGEEGDATTEIGRVGADDIDTETTIVIDPIVHRNSALTVYDDDYWRECPEAVGSGYVVIQQRSYRSWGMYDYRLSTVDLATGRIVDEIVVPQAAAGGMTAASGSSIVMLEAPDISTTDLIMISPDGKLSQSTIGRSGFFSEAL